MATSLVSCIIATKYAIELQDLTCGFITSRNDRVGGHVVNDSFLCDDSVLKEKTGRKKTAGHNSMINCFISVLGTMM